MNKHKCSHIIGYYLLTRQRNPSLRWHKSVVGFGLPKKKKWWSCAKCFLLTYYTIASLLPVGDEFRSIAPREEKTKNSQLLCIHVNECARIDWSLCVCVSVSAWVSVNSYDHRIAVRLVSCQNELRTQRMHWIWIPIAHHWIRKSKQNTERTQQIWSRNFTSLKVCSTHQHST